MDTLSKSVGRVVDILNSPSGSEFMLWLARGYDAEWTAQINQLESLLMHPLANRQYADWMEARFVEFTTLHR